MPVNISLQTLSSEAGRVLKRAGKERAGDDLAWAWFNLGAADMGRTIVQRLSAGKMDPQLEAIFGQPWKILEVGAMSLAFEDVMTALDLCADAVFLICGEPTHPKGGAPGQFYDLGNLKKRQGQLDAPAAIRGWIGQLLQDADKPDGDMTVLKDCRDALAHRQVRQHPMATFTSGVPTGMALSEITTLHGQGRVQGRGSIGELIPRLVGFGEAQLESLCKAILTPSSTSLVGPRQVVRASTRAPLGE